jgi:hypothetical protein
MQGHVACQVNSAFFRLYLPEFPAGSSAFPGRGGFVIFIFFPGYNPVKYTDPDGRLLRNEDGTLKFEEEKQAPAVHGDGTKSEKGKLGNLYADDGTPIAAFQNLDPKAPGLDTDCHGVTFADEQYWINDDQVESILAGDNYTAVDIPIAGDIAILRNAESGIIHSVTVVNVADTEITVRGLGGTQTEIHQDPIQDVEREYNNATTTYYRKGVGQNIE